MENLEDTKLTLWIEWCTLFVMVPITLALPLPLWIKGLLAGGGLVYTIWVGRSQGDGEKLKFQWPITPTTPMIFRFATFMAITTLLMYSYYPEDFLKVVWTKPLLFAIIIIVYTFLSVLPQEWLYRVFYTERYDGLIENEHLATLVNASIFSLAHLFLFNYLVLVLTFLGGLLFYRTYRQSNSFWLTSLEHAAYGLWLFTLGAGDMLAFPS